jgi:hypothetical protein
MSVVYLLLGGRDEIVKGIITPDGFHVFSIYDFMQIVMIGNKNHTYVKKEWKKLSRQHSNFMEVGGTLALAVPSSKMPKKPPTAGTTVAGLKGVLDVLGNSVAETRRKTVGDIFARYMLGDRSMVVEVNLNATVHPQMPRLSYNFQPPTASSNAPVASIIVEDAEPSSEEDSDSMQFDFSSTEDHIVREQDVLASEITVATQ